MASLLLSAQPGFTEIADTTFDDGNPVTAATMKALNASAKFAAVRDEQFWGFYKHGETVVLPTSPADGYAYERAELTYDWSIVGTGTPGGGAYAGVQVLPAGAGGNGGGGQLLSINAMVDEATGAVSTLIAYYITNGAQSNTHDGVLMVRTHAQRLR
jgi:hypothetical protein